MNMKLFYWFLAAGLLINTFYCLDFKAKFSRCEESVIGPEAAVGRCAYPARVMHVKGVWVCSGRSEAETKRSIE
ncbi:hypothetical protein M0R72_00480 [Candidatus Pacearchaeota archaeon]|jgi:hypothetical protein|nr:hypothetical protein [Candidatus Pacearchaeota archaeon]